MPPPPHPTVQKALDLAVENMDKMVAAKTKQKDGVDAFVAALAPMLRAVPDKEAQSKCMMDMLQLVHKARFTSQSTIQVSPLSTPSPPMLSSVRPSPMRTSSFPLSAQSTSIAPSVPSTSAFNPPPTAYNSAFQPPYQYDGDKTYHQLQ